MASIALDRAGGIEQRVLARAGPAAAHVDRGDRRAIEDDRGDAGGELRVIGMADADAGDIGEEVFQGGDSMRCQCISDIAPTPTRFNSPSAIRIIRASSDFAVGLGQQQHAGIEPAVMHDGVLGVARGEQHLQAGPPPRPPRRRAGGRSCGPGMITSVNSRSMPVPASMISGPPAALAASSVA